ncbi:serine hydrolase domain-containing protein [Phenylobacterium terrae]|uniref:Serine hydrolase domain-containing protein n=1 Tax=Phenylobacterium terrae TaxID=2665495 RepID=A0ABW4N647_9CAUL
MQEPTQSADADSISAAWTRVALDYLGSWLDFQVRQARQPGCAVAVAQDGELLWEAAFGRADLGTGEALTPRHRFRVASLSKTLTAVGLMRLAEAGRLRLDDSAGAFVDGLHPAVARVTLTQLLSHSAGLSRDGADASYFADLRPFPSRDEVLEELRRPPVIEPGLRLKYSNYGYALLGLVIEAVTGEAYCDWTAREVIAACGLSETTPDAPSDPSRLARGHTGALPAGRLTIPGQNSTEAFACVTGLTATAADMARFYGRLAPAAAGALLSEASRRDMIQPRGHDDDSALGRAYGLGVHVGETAGWSYFGHVGRFQGVVTRVLTLPETGLSLAVIANAIDGPAVSWIEGAVRILRRFHDEGAPAGYARDWTSRWWSLWGPLDVVALGDKVLAYNPAEPTPFAEAIEITLQGPDSGVVSRAPVMDRYGEPVARRVGQGGRPSLLRIGSAAFGDEAAAAQRIRAQYGRPSAAQLQGEAGQ